MLNYFSTLQLVAFLIFLDFRIGLAADYPERIPSKPGKNKGLIVNYYHLTVKVEIEQQRIEGVNRVVGSCKPNEPVKLDLAPNLRVDSIISTKKGLLSYERTQEGQIIIEYGTELTRHDTIAVYYSGSPRKARKAPWDGGFVWTQDQSGKPWVGVACQGIGASVWWPLRDELFAEPDSMRISIRAPKGLMAVSNGNLESVIYHADSTSTWNWLVSYPINPYNVTLNVADYVHINDVYYGAEGKLALDYYVLRGNESKARSHFRQVHDLLNCFEQKLGPYPFYRDGYALVETPYWGMEHQSCIAYGNNYINNEWGFDFIIVHESGHEWFGNNISVPDNAELWIHESLTTYAEAIFVECRLGREASHAYMLKHRKMIANREPLLGPLGVKFNERKTSDIYYKGAWVWYTIRNSLQNDSIWWNLIRNIRDTFRLQIVDTKTLIDYVNRQTKQDWASFFNLYLNCPELPVLEYRFLKEENHYYLEHRWVLPKGFENFRLSVPLIDEGRKHIFSIEPSTSWKREKLPFTTEPLHMMEQSCERLLVKCKLK